MLGLSDEITNVMMWKNNQERIMESKRKMPLEVFQPSAKRKMLVTHHSSLLYRWRPFSKPPSLLF